ncbi:MAG: HlyC/CorC family transporter [Chlamydiae bacterium CG10_big_fil_rev_8_21_14_0_10_42_34]|nr:MAG: HlyC/CorC family transporter [Chlamydiae bacterium CG10_big_fil_rev_8_21_14_0_10_42_34]
MILFLAILILLSAFLSGSETALFSLSPLTVKSYRNATDSRLLSIGKMMERPREVLVTILILNILANVLIQNTVSTIFDHYESWALKIGVPLGLTLIFGEVLPKSLALPSHSQVAYRAAPVIQGAAAVLKPIRGPLTKATGWISRTLFFFLKEEKEISPDELRHVLKTSEERGILLPVESELIGGTLDLQNSLVKEHMRPREEILAYDVQDPLSELMDLFIKKETTRVPIYDGDLENMLGILSARQFFFHREKIKKPSDLLTILRKPYYIPETTQGWAALRNLRERRVSLAIVVDEYGSISGLIAQEDLVEAVIGEIVDARDAANLYTRSSQDVIIASGKLELSEFEEVFGIELKTQDHIVTLGGWLIEQLGDIPVTGTKYATDQFLFYVLAADPNRIRRIYVRRLVK